MKLTPKEVACSHCGHTFIADREKSWCEKCCRPVFYDITDQRRHKLFGWTIVGAVLALITIATYLVIEYVVQPLSRL